ncbi:MAG: glutathione peroxidase [Betaproteobacteria bacterium HGW-Betaproteobacteria-11]|nr:MAG: glutathione peroxidase [Betaproteobacteria bacterium HGW-Betaproteobacteria-11]
MTTVFDFTARRLDDSEQALADYRGKVLLIVNVASQCGFTPQYTGLEQLWRDYRERGLRVLGFPCNQFGAQEPGDAAAIAGFCASQYAVSFPLFAKIEVNGPATHPLWQHLKQAAPGLLGSTAIKWNFTKFLVAADGQVIGRFAPATRPEELRGEIERLLQPITPAT